MGRNYLPPCPNVKRGLSEPPLKLQLWMRNYIPHKTMHMISNPYRIYKRWINNIHALWTVVITQPQSIVVGKYFTVAIIKLLNVISRIPISHLLPIYFCTNSSWNVRAAICLEGRLSLLALSSIYSLTVEDGSWSTPMVPVWDDILTPLYIDPGVNISYDILTPGSIYRNDISTPLTIFWPPFPIVHQTVLLIMINC